MLDFQISKQYSIELYQHKNTRSQLIVLSPELETWILKVTKASKIDIGKYNLPSKPSV